MVRHRIRDAVLFRDEVLGEGAVVQTAPAQGLEPGDVVRRACGRVDERQRHRSLVAGPRPVALGMETQVRRGRAGQIGLHPGRAAADGPGIGLQPAAPDEIIDAAVEGSGRVVAFVHHAQVADALPDAPGGEEGQDFFQVVAWPEHFEAQPRILPEKLRQDGEEARLDELGQPAVEDHQVFPGVPGWVRGPVRADHLVGEGGFGAAFFGGNRPAGEHRIHGAAQDRKAGARLHVEAVIDFWVHDRLGAHEIAHEAGRVDQGGDVVLFFDAAVGDDQQVQAGGVDGRGETAHDRDVRDLVARLLFHAGGVLG
jgi:hypothetical protein